MVENVVAPNFAAIHIFGRIEIPDQTGDTGWKVPYLGQFLMRGDPAPAFQDRLPGGFGIVAHRRDRAGARHYYATTLHFRYSGRPGPCGRSSRIGYSSMLAVMKLIAS